ncbi:MAG: class I SAM-dependent methyltransferase [Anaerolineales bacterium]|nr:class I SAM-dependent methyltransferase [Anaerolineales bacterium]
MKNKDFETYKSRFITAIREVLNNAEPGSLDEAAFPAYSHPNPVVNHLFWKRIHTVINHIERSQPYESILDFGCGSGVMLPCLAQVSNRVIAVDVDLAPLKKVGEYITFAENISVYDARDPHNQKFPTASFDLVIALDVLEHVQDLEQTLRRLVSLLKPGGQVIVSGPTENLFYQVGRWLAGPEYSGDYHERTIGDIRAAFQPLGAVRRLRTLYPFLPLFEIFTVTR